jgi:hypothetical protein
MTIYIPRIVLLVSMKFFSHYTNKGYSEKEILW